MNSVRQCMLSLTSIGPSIIWSNSKLNGQPKGKEQNKDVVECLQNHYDSTSWAVA